MKKYLAILFFVSLFFFPNIAQANMIEIANVSAHYAHPLTGVVEDSGNDSAIGQGMCESVLDPQALVETDDTGKVFVTLRIHMAGELGKYQLAVQNQGDKGFYGVKTTEMKRDNEAFDLRFMAPSKDAIVRLELYVKAMGRNVIFYGALLDRVEGNTDFVLSIAPNENDEVKKSMSFEASDEALSTTEDAPQAELKKEVGTKREASDLKGPVFGGEVGLLLKGDPRLSADFKEVHSEEDDKAPYGPFTLFALYSFFIVLAVLATLIFLSGILALLYARRLTYRNDRREAKAYGLEKSTS